MSCVKPLTAWLMPYMVAGQFKNEISFKECPDSNKISIPCGQSIGCRLERSRQWAMRCMHEAQLHEENCFITLTYNDRNLPDDQSLNHDHFVKFIKRLRKLIAPKRIRFYMAGEYGTQFGRPHYHACIFGWSPPDKKWHKKTKSGCNIYTSEILASAWKTKHSSTRKWESTGFSSVGDVTFESAAYIARYIVTKQTGNVGSDHYHWCDLKTGEIHYMKPEYNRMSLRPMSGIKGEPGGIGAEWYKKFKSDVYPHDYVIVRGKKMKPPKAYDKLYKKDNPFEYDELLYKRETNAKLNPDNQDPKRLDAKRQIYESRLSMLKRTLT